MAETREMAAGGYAFVPGVFQYSAGVGALPGYRIERVRFATPTPLAHGFERIAQYLRDLGRPLGAFCACELRSPGQFSEDGFKAFNDIYAGTLRDWGILSGDSNPVARANVCPDIDPPAEPAFHAFCYTMPAREGAPSFAISGSGEVPEGKATYKDHIVRRGETGPEALRDKARWVLSEMERRMAAFGDKWADTTAVQLYTVHDVHPFIADELVCRGAARNGLTWHYARPPVVELDYEMDCRRIHVEHVL